LKLETLIKYSEADASSFNPAFLGTEVDSFAIDSREVKAGEVFFALSQPEYKNNCFNGDFADSHVYIPKAFELGATACVARKDRFKEHEELLKPFADRLLFVEDAIVALQKLAHGVYLEWNKPVVAVTGSAGKTTAKQLTAHVLTRSGRKVLSNIKNYNNGLGHPLTVLNLAKDSSYDVAVLEMGMSTPNNEIARLCRITPPDVAVELNVLPVHLEHLGSIENITKAKAELVEGMKSTGIAVLNRDDFRVFGMSSSCKNYIDFGIDNEADITAHTIEFLAFGETSFILKTPKGSARVLFPLNGNHNILNALAAAAVGFHFGMTVIEIAEALQSVEAPSQRGEVVHFKDFTIINDSYNSNPDALLSMVKTLVDGGKSVKRKIVVAGEMRELGSDAENIHFQTGKQIANYSIDALYGVENLANNLLAGAKENGLTNVKFYENSNVAAEEFIKEVKAGDLILIKGSRGVKTEKIIDKLLQTFDLAND
jgi:UDP-N-acetylmuramoyl-tripeptide--D-alanyl-D-alanine ligase